MLRTLLHQVLYPEEFLNANAPISKSLEGFLRKFTYLFNHLHMFFAKDFTPLNNILPKDLMKSPKSSAAIVLSLTVIDFFLLHIEHSPKFFLRALETLSPTIFVVAEWCVLPSKKANSFEFLETQSFFRKNLYFSYL